MSDKQRLNSLDRFRKQPGRLVLEEHGHCEVPAGCGGVVLRWRNPHAVVPLTVHLYAPGLTAAFLDGQPLPTARIDLPPGRHVAAFVLQDVDMGAGLILFAAVHDPTTYQQTLPTDVAEQPVKVLSAADGTWKFTLEPPPEGWTSPSFDDRDWPALTRAASKEPGWQDAGAYQYEVCARQGAVCLGIPPDPGPKGRPSWWQRLLGRQSASPAGRLEKSLWVRRVFDINPPQSVGQAP